MGIPRFYRWLKERYPLIRMDLFDAQKQKPIFDNLYIDFNAMIYQCIRESGCFLKNKIQPLTLQQIHQRVLQYLLELVRIVDPQKLIFIAFDGVAPRAKINQSRDRRFRSGVEDIQFFQKLVQQVGIKGHQIFQSNSISPGTEFLFQLCVSLKGKLMELMQTEWKGLKVLYSDCCVPGQGQHKIMDFLRYSKELELFNDNTTHCVYSPDADVILLTLALDLQYISIIKQDTSQPNSMSWTASSVYRKLGPPQFQVVFINILREYLSCQFSEELQTVKGCCIQDIIDDFVLLMAFIGNDFLPVEFCFKLTDSHMDALFSHYRDYLKHNKQFFNKRGLIDWQKVTALLGVARKFQANRIGDLKAKFQTTKQLRNQQSVFDQKDKKQQENYNSEIDKFQVQDDKIVKGIGEYYRSRFNIVNREHNIQFTLIIKKYIEGLQFYCQYYYRGLPSWTWFYPFLYTPLLHDVHQYLLKHPIKVKLIQAEPYDPIQALIFMLPQQNFGLLPKPLAAALTHPSCILRHPLDYFPTKFQLDKFQTLNYSKKAVIQFLKDDDVKKVYEGVLKDGFNKKETQRNQKKNTIIFFHEENKPFTGLEVSFDQRSKTELRRIIRPAFDGPQKQNKRCRFPSLAHFGQQLQLTDNGKVISTHKYKPTGNPSDLVFFNNFIGYVESQQKVTQGVKAQIEAEYEKKGHIKGNCEHLFVVKRGRYIREPQRHFVALTRKEVLVPDFALFKAPNNDYLPSTRSLKQSELYMLKERVAILSAQYFGCTGIIEELGQDTLKVRLYTDPIKSESKIQEFEEEFFSIDFVLKQLEVSRQTLFAIISEVILLPIVGKKKQWNQRIPTALNFGLSFIDIGNAKIVPHFVRCNFKFQNTKSPQKMFDDLQFSRSALSLLQKYMTTFPWLVELLQEWRSPKIRKQFKAGNVFGREKDPNIHMYRQFVKLYAFQNKGSFCSIYSKTADLNNLPKMYTEKKSQKATITLKYHEVISRRLGLKAPPAYRTQPEYHDIGSRVLLLRNLEVGYVVCIDDCWIHVVVGKDKRKFKVKFADLYNQNWNVFLAKEAGKAWNLDVGYYTPTFWKTVTA